MSLSLTSLLVWVGGASLEALVFALAWRHKIYSRLPFFFSYLAILLFNDFVMFFVYRAFGFRSITAFYAYWIIQALCIAARGLVVYEICRWILSPFVGVWRLARPILLFIAGILILIALLTTRASAYPLAAAILTAERGLEFAVVGILIAGLVFCRYYSVRIERYLTWIAFGLGFYSAFQVADNTFLQHWLQGFAIWEGLRHLSFNVVLALWGVALWKPLPAAVRQPVLLTDREYELYAPQVKLQLRELNTRLLEMWK